MNFRTPTLQSDGFALESAEARAKAHPESFGIPSLSRRAGLAEGSLAKLIFSIASASGADVSVERMWVVVRTVRDDGYVGWLANNPRSVGAKSDHYLRVWCEVPFGAEHVIDVQDRNEEWLRTTVPARPSRSWNMEVPL